MVTQHSFKQRVRARMAKTGESYTAARRMLIAAGDAPEPAPTAWTPPVSDAALRKATGDGWDAWLERLDATDATKRTHAAIARGLMADGMDGWWAQTVTVGYERARGMRALGQHADGWSVSASRTIGVPVATAHAAVLEGDAREAWLPGADIRLRTQSPRVVRYDWEDGSTRVVITLDAKGDRSVSVSIEHARLPDADTAAAMKAFWRARVAALKTTLESLESLEDPESRVPTPVRRQAPGPDLT